MSVDMSDRDHPEMKKTSSKIREDIAKLQEQLRLADTREAERIGRIALKAGLGDIQIEEAELLAAFEAVAKGFQGGKGKSPGERKNAAAEANGAGPAAGIAGEA
jgi:hypothetical protein